MVSSLWTPNMLCRGTLLCWKRKGCKKLPQDWNHTFIQKIFFYAACWPTYHSTRWALSASGVMFLSILWGSSPFSLIDILLNIGRRNTLQFSYVMFTSLIASLCFIAEQARHTEFIWANSFKTFSCCWMAVKSKSVQLWDFIQFKQRGTIQTIKNPDQQHAVSMDFWQQTGFLDWRMLPVFPQS